jgi:hypothetical protein
MNLFYYNWVMVDDDLLLMEVVINKTYDRKSPILAKQNREKYCCAM